MWDPLRKKEVADTPEERVRQWFIAQLRDTVGVPAHQMMSEVGFAFGGKHYRADILVYGPAATRLAVVECKRPEVGLTAEVLEQAMGYNMVLDVSWLIVTNGRSTYIYKKNGTEFAPCASVPTYGQMCSDGSR